MDDSAVRDDERGKDSRATDGTTSVVFIHRNDSASAAVSICVLNRLSAGGWCECE